MRSIVQFLGRGPGPALGSWKLLDIRCFLVHSPAFPGFKIGQKNKVFNEHFFFMQEIIGGFSPIYPKLRDFYEIIKEINDIHDLGVMLLLHIYTVFFLKMLWNTFKIRRLVNISMYHNYDLIVLNFVYA